MIGPRVASGEQGFSAYVLQALAISDTALERAQPIELRPALVNRESGAVAASDCANASAAAADVAVPSRR